MGRPTADLSKMEKVEICELYSSGTPIAEIGAAYDITNGTVSGVAKSAGLPPRQRRAARALEGASFSIDHIEIEDVDGEPRVVDIALGKALGYERPRSIKQLIERFIGPLRELGPAPQRVARGGEGARESREYLLNLAQINYLITRCGLPSADEWCIQIARVFTAWQTKRLEAVDLDTAVKLQDGAEAAEIALPDVHRLTHEMIRRIIRDETAHLATKDHLISVHLDVQAISHRKEPSTDTKRQHITTVREIFNGFCPCCVRVQVLAADNSVGGHYDHWTDNNAKNGAHETWLVCAGCNMGFKDRKLDRHVYRQVFDVYQMRRKQILEGAQSSLFPEVG